MRGSSLSDSPEGVIFHRPVVILLHGIGRTYRSMRPIEKSLSKSGYTVLNIDYPSRKKNIQAIAAQVYLHIHPLNDNTGPEIHFVTHSMGGLVVRQLLSQYSFHHLGRVIMIAPPNQGSEIADFLNNNVLFKWYYGPAGQELCTKAAKCYPLPKVNYDLGIIAGKSFFNPISHFLMPTIHDGKVTIESTKMPGMKDHIVVKANHTFIMYKECVISEVKYFLERAKFHHQQFEPH